MMSQQQLSTVRDGRVQLAIMSAFVEVEVYAFWRLVFGISRYPSFVEVRARVFFELLSDEGRRWNFASCPGFVVRRVRAYPNFPQKNCPSVRPSVCLSVCLSKKSCLFFFGPIYPAYGSQMKLEFRLST